MSEPPIGTDKVLDDIKQKRKRLGPWEGLFGCVDEKREHLINAAALLVAEIERIDRGPCSGGKASADTDQTSG
ncbi:MAG TPA: hypothetical protein VGL45_09795 [Bradyrhizobium sp.]|jgi:hypothetical protein